MDNPAFYKEECLGSFEGNILEAIAQLFPPAPADHFRREPPVHCNWRVMERITWEGRRGHHFNTDPAVCKRVNDICDAIYTERHKRHGYPTYYTENTEAEGLPMVCIDASLIAIWQPVKVELPSWDSSGKSV